LVYSTVVSINWPIFDSSAILLFGHNKNEITHTADKNEYCIFLAQHLQYSEHTCSFTKLKSR